MEEKNTQSVKDEFSKMILSASGWRKIFASSSNEQDATTEVKYEDLILVCHAAASFLEFIKNENSAIKKIVIGTDTRPTGSIIKETVLKVLSLSDLNVIDIGYTAAPEIMAYSKVIDAAFIYVSASHNPIGHNGLKFGLNSGGVINGTQSKTLIDIFTKKCFSENSVLSAADILENPDLKKITHISTSCIMHKKEAIQSYYLHLREVIADTKNIERQNAFFGLCKENALQNQLCIVADFNGSARSVSVDRMFFEECGITLIGIAEKPGDIKHAILPEGVNLNFCAEKMEDLHKDDNGFKKNCFLGYMPDCDGDRGNIIYWDSKKHKAVILQAQEVFVLSLIAELAYSDYVYEDSLEHMKFAVAVNGPTSLRVEEAAECFNAEVFRAEVGEANVVNLASELRSKGFTVRILGEGSNGGNITHPSCVRDPLNTIFAILKLLLIKTQNGKKGLFHRWCEKSGQIQNYKEIFSLDDILETLPKYTTTPVGEDRALLHICENNHTELKRRYQKIFEEQWFEKKDYLLSNFGITKYRVFCNNGTIQKNDITDFGISARGGLKIQFYDCKNKPIAFIWMRGSGTEPVFRIMADIKGNSESAEKYLVLWQAEMVKQADVKA